MLTAVLFEVKININHFIPLFSVAVSSYCGLEACTTITQIIYSRDDEPAGQGERILLQPACLPAVFYALSLSLFNLSNQFGPHQYVIRTQISSDTD